MRMKWIFVIALGLTGCGVDPFEQVCRRAHECQLLEIGMSVGECREELEAFEARLPDPQMALLDDVLEECMERRTCVALADCLADGL